MHRMRGEVYYEQIENNMDQPDYDAYWLLERW